jgi:hypothetical protein
MNTAPPLWQSQTGEPNRYLGYDLPHPLRMARAPLGIRPPSRGGFPIRVDLGMRPVAMIRGLQLGFHHRPVRDQGWLLRLRPDVTALSAVPNATLIISPVDDPR